MSELETINKSTQLITIEVLIQDFKHLGLKAGMTILVHSSLSSMGWVSGGAVSVVQALMKVVTNKGTIVMPTHSSDLSDPSRWGNPPVPKDWWDEIKNTMPPYDPLIVIVN